LPDPRPLLSGWAGGERAGLLSELSREQIVEKAILSLSAIFEISQDELRFNLQRADIFDWQAEDPGLYGYSYATLKSGPSRKILNEPVENTVFFAGEGLHEGPSPGTVEAALASGKEVAAKLKKLVPAPA
jgi:monoamine oxidase